MRRTKGHREAQPSDPEEEREPQLEREHGGRDGARTASCAPRITGNAGDQSVNYSHRRERRERRGEGRGGRRQEEEKEGEEVKDRKEGGNDRRRREESGGGHRGQIGGCLALSTPAWGWECRCKDTWPGPWS
jgi:hypothetical protein